MPSRTNITVIGTEYYQPIADLLGKLISKPYAGSDRTGALNYYERGRSVSIILLLCAAVESLVQRDRYFSSKSKKTPISNSALHKYVRSELKYRRHARLEELFVVRNAIAHNHIWEVEFRIKPEGGREHKQSTLVPGSHQISTTNLPVQKKVPRSRRLKIHMSPGSIDRFDVQKALSCSIHFLEFLSIKGNSPVNLLNEQVALLGKLVRFSDLPQKIEDAQ